jgi:hypothetical protein
VVVARAEEALRAAENRTERSNRRGPAPDRQAEA